MSYGLCGWIGGRTMAANARGVIEQMASACAGPAASQSRFLVGSVATLSAGDAFQRGPLLAAICGHAVFEDARLAELARREGMAAALADAYAARGSDAITLLRGDFALAVLDEQRGEAVLAIDRMGVRSLSYSITGERLVFGTSADAVNQHPEFRPELDPQGIYDYVYFHMVPAPATAYRGQRRLLPGHLLRYAASRIETAPYWEMRFDERARVPFDQLKGQFLDTLRSAVRESSAQGKAGAFLSGGTDSSTIAGMLGEVSGEPARTYSIGFKAEGYDEMEYARIAARHFGTRHHEYYVTPDDVVAAIPRIAAAHDQPFGNASAVPTFYCAKLAKDDGIDTLLGGDGGDELFGGNERYAKQYLYSLYSDLPSILRESVIEPIAFALPEGIGVIGKAQRYIRNASQPMPARYDNYNLLERLGAAQVFTAGFLASVDAQQPRALMADAYRQAHAETLINRMLALDLRFTLADNDLPKVTRSCELAGVDVRFPMLDDAVVAFSASLAPGLKLKGTRLRYFFKQALRGFLPDQILTKSKHGFGLPFGLWLQTHQPLQHIARDSLAGLKRRDIVRPEFIDELTSMHVQSHAGYYGTMVWVLMMLEQWFRQHRSA
jgi:asparagine synthase (glutamine-hydrolysing)